MFNKLFELQDAKVCFAEACQQRTYLEKNLEYLDNAIFVFWQLIDLFERDKIDSLNNMCICYYYQ